MSKIVDYRICSEKTVGKLENAVQKMIKSGWNPIGGPFTTNHGDDIWYEQAMIWYEQTKDMERI